MVFDHTGSSGMDSFHTPNGATSSAENKISPKKIQKAAALFLLSRHSPATRPDPGNLLPKVVQRMPQKQRKILSVVLQLTVQHTFQKKHKEFVSSPAPARIKLIFC